MYKIKEKPEDFIVIEQSKIEFDEQGQYAYIEITKKDSNTIYVARRIAQFLKLKDRDIGFAGSKDRYAITKQAMSIKDPHNNINSEKLKKCLLDGVEITYLGRGNKPISLGDLEGNKFEIILRDCERQPDKVTQIVNYYDEQRFSKLNKEIGKHLIKKEFKEACEKIDAESVAEHLEEVQNDFVGALKTVPVKIRMMYVHAYQSYIWNKIVASVIKDKNKLNKEIKYSLGYFVFPLGKIENQRIPIIGFGTEMSEINSEIRKLLRDIIKQEEITTRNFIIPSLPEISSEGGYRDMIVDVKDFKIDKISEHDYKLSFVLGKGSYATIVVKRSMI